MLNLPAAALACAVIASSALPAQAAEIVVYGTVAAKAALTHIVLRNWWGRCAELGTGTRTKQQRAPFWRR